MVRVDPVTAWGLLCGLGLGLGLWSMVSLLPRLSRPRLTSRIAPYVVDVSAGARALLARRGVEPLPVFGPLFAPVIQRILAWLGSTLGGAAIIELRLRQSASISSLETFRARQLAFGVGAAVIGLTVTIVTGRLSSMSPALLLPIIAVSIIIGILVCDRMLQHAAAKRLARITGELPTVLEFLTLSLAAGEGILDALRRIGRASHGELAAELGVVVERVNTGVPLAESLTALADGLRLPALTRCIEQLNGALERGTPLAEVLRAQAQDARVEAKRELLEMAGKKEVAMLGPLVFFILPVTIVFAIYPGIFVLQVGL